MPSCVVIALSVVTVASFHVLGTSGLCSEQSSVKLPDFSAQWLDLKPYMSNASGDTQGVLYELLSVLNETLPLTIQLGRRYNINDFQEFKNATLTAPPGGRGLIVLPVTRGKKDYPDPCIVSAYNAQGSAYIVKRNVKKPLLQLGNSFINGGQIMAIILILSIISGIFIWMLDRRSNGDCFPASFITGTWQGFWWAFVTMTTVGYGDIYPKSVQARLYSIVWMLIGMVAFSLLTANITNSLTYAIESDMRLYGKIIAVLNESMDRHAAVAYGAGFKEYPNVSSMAIALYEDEVNAMLLETHIASGTPEVIETDFLEIAKTIDYSHFFGMHMHHVAQNVCTVIKQCVEEVLDDHEFQSKVLKILSDQVVLDQLAKASDNLFEDPSFFYILVGIFTFMGIVGVLWEYCYFRKKMRRRAEAETAQPSAAEVEGGTPEAEDDQAVETKQVTVRSIRVRPTRQWSPNF